LMKFQLARLHVDALFWQFDIINSIKT
jgi:hypothetical protein